MEVCPRRPGPVWRELQYQHIYNECQVAMSAAGRDFCVYFGPAYIAPEARGLCIPERHSQELGLDIVLGGGIWMSMSTLEALRNNRVATQ